MRLCPPFTILAPIGVVVFFLSPVSGWSEVALPSIGVIDVNHDGRISKDEYSRARLKRIFDKINVDGNQAIELEEWQQFDKSAAAKENYRFLDANGDGEVTLEEFLKRAPDRSNLDGIFVGMDKDNDGYISPKEYGASAIRPGPALTLFSIRF